MYTVVVADDEQELRRALVRNVDWETLGFRMVGEAENGVEALELVERLEPDLLLTDIKMPYVSGIELARQVREIKPATQIAFLSGYDDFRYAQQAIQYNIISYILKPISAEEISNELRKIKDKIDEKYEEFTSHEQTQERLEEIKFFMPLILDEFRNNISENQQKEIIEKAKNSNFFSQNSEQRYCILVSEFYSEDGCNETEAANTNAIDTILKKYVKHISFYTEGKIVALLMATQAGFDKYLHILADEITTSVQRIMKKNCYVGISRTSERIDNIHEHYVEAMNAIGYARRNESKVQFISDIQRVDEYDMERLQNFNSEVEDLIKTGNSNELTTYLNQTFDRFVEEQIPIGTLNFMLVQMIYTVFQLVYVLDDPVVMQELQKQNPLQHRSNFERFSEIREQYLRFCVTAQEIINEQRKKSSTLICEKAIKIIESNYMDTELSLVSLSNEIAVSPNYLSALFKKETGNTFIEILTKKRMNVAKEMLMCSAMKIREISEKCGYSDQHYFSYCFKKEMGISPNACRRRDNEEYAGENE